MFKTTGMSTRQNEMESQIVIEMKSLKTFSGLSDDAISVLAHYGVIKNFKKGEYLWTRGEPGLFCTTIIEGVVEIGKSTQEGASYIIGLFGPADVVGISALIGKKAFPADACAASKQTRVIKFYLRSIKGEAQTEIYDEIQSWLRERLVAHEQLLREKIDIVGAGSVENRLKVLLKHFVERFGRPVGKQIEIPVPISKTQMAHIIDIRVETVIRTMNKWEKAGYIKMSGQGIIIVNTKELCSSC